jgi:hypothetical protein
MLTPPLSHACFFHFSDTCSLGSNGSTKFLESMLSLISFWRAGLALVLECYVPLKLAVSLFRGFGTLENVAFSCMLRKLVTKLHKLLALIRASFGE